MTLCNIQTLAVGPLAPHEVSQLLYNKPKNRFANIFPCEIQFAEDKIWIPQLSESR